MTEDEKRSINEENCTCCNKKWDNVKIVQIKETGEWTKRKFMFFPSGWEEAFYVTYQLVCNDCKISIRFTKYIPKKDFKPKCAKEVKQKIE